MLATYSTLQIEFYVLAISSQCATYGHEIRSKVVLPQTDARLQSSEWLKIYYSTI